MANSSIGRWRPASEAKSDVLYMAYRVAGRCPVIAHKDEESSSWWFGDGGLVGDGEWSPHWIAEIKEQNFPSFRPEDFDPKTASRKDVQAYPGSELTAASKRVHEEAQAMISEAKRDDVYPGPAPSAETLRKEIGLTDEGAGGDACDDLLLAVGKFLEAWDATGASGQLGLAKIFDEVRNSVSHLGFVAHRVRGSRP